MCFTDFYNNFCLFIWGLFDDSQLLDQIESTGWITDTRQIEKHLVMSWQNLGHSKISLANNGK
jgi:hypothetical protein